ncbi:YycC family protein [Cohnella panacarvi]|uniref:YycC family protein n=1 Tax=Cohnella panacarvi TaxID=400776 RepID=UPI0004B9097C|nr:YycC family protein [Cohnella panacarvi]
MRPMPISADTALKLSKFMNVPVEHLMHMPQHVLLQKLAEMAMAEGGKDKSDNGGKTE